MKILFATDGSCHSDNAIEAILAQSWPAGTKCEVVTVAAPFHANFARFEGGMGAMGASGEAALMEDLNKMLAETNDKLSPKFGKENVTTILREGSPAATILEIAGNSSTDLIVMGAHGTSGYNDDSHGSVAALVTNHAPCSVQIVNYIGAESIDKKIQNHLPLRNARILIAISEATSSQAVIDTAISRDWPEESTFQVLSIVQEPKSVFHSRFFKDHKISESNKVVFAKQKERLENLVKSVAASLEAKFDKHKVTHHVLEGNVASLILQVAQDWPADMILIGAHERDKNIFEHVLGSTSQGVVKNADCSVEIVRKRQK